jgi:hypothetical protein
MIKQFLDNVMAMFRRSGSPTKRMGTIGTAVHGGYVQPVESSSDMTGTKKFEIFSEMLVNISIIAAGVRYFLNLVSKPDWTVEPPEDSGDAGQEVADKVSDAIFKMETPWFRVVRRAAMFRFYGFSWQEWTAKKNKDGSIGYLDIEPRAQKTIERWDIDEWGKVHGVLQRSPQTMQEHYIPRAKSVYFVDDSLNDSPEGLGLFRHMAEGARVLNRLEQLEGWGFELDCRGMPVGRGPFSDLQDLVDSGEMSESKKAEIEQPLSDFIENHVQSPQRGLFLDSKTYATEDEKGTPSSIYKWGVELLKAGATNLGDLNNAIMRKVRDLARIMGVETLLLGETGAGSLAMAKDKSGNFFLIVDSTLKELSEGFEKDVIDPLMKLNGWPEELKPSLKVEKVQYKDVTELTQALVDMAQAGAVLDPEDPAINAIRDLLGLPIITEEMMQENAEDASLEGMPPPGQEVPPNEPPPGEVDEEVPEGPAPDGEVDDDKKKKKEK